MALPSLSTAEMRRIETLINRWKTKLTWELLVNRIESDLGINTTRQTLVTYNSIKSSYDSKKQELRGVPSLEFNTFVKSDIDSFERIERLKAENEILKKQVDKQLAFIRKVGELSSSNPSLRMLLNEVKASI
ncbi:MAG: hypothetical protein ACJAZP_002383 [Psychromonas sp.]|jgi:hypothetical protein|uniref:hypothetical protein n=1 Tax=Psychromonas sp. TaxID=1884585 RepID=UPI0039E63342